MRKYRVNQQVIVLNVYSTSINEILVAEFMTESLIESKCDVKYINAVKSAT